jgi:hypothetical protein
MPFAAAAPMILRSRRRRFPMSVSGIASSSLFNDVSSSNVQNQQQWLQAFQQLGQAVPSASLSIAQTPGQTAAQIKGQTELATLQPPSSPASLTSPAQSGNPVTPAFDPRQANPTPGSHFHFHHRFRVGADQNGATQESDQLAQAFPSATSSTAQQAYTSWQQDLQQVALNTDLITAQSAALQSSATSVSLSA